MNFGYHRTVIQSIPGGFKVSRRNNSVAISQEERPQALVKDEEATRLHVADADEFTFFFQRWMQSSCSQKSLREQY